LSSYILLKPKEGWARLRKLADNDDGDTGDRYHAFLVVRFFHDVYPDIIGKKELLAVVDKCLTQADMADFTIDVLRGWKEWGLTKEVLGFWDVKSHEIPGVRRAIVKYALQCRDDAARQFVTQLRKDNREFVEETEEFLKIEEDRARMSK
jgi:hypothetical protein